MYSINDPTIHTNMICEDVAVDRRIIDASRGTNGCISIESQSWWTYSVTVQKTDTAQDIIVPVAVRGLKALYFNRACTSLDGFISTSCTQKWYTNY